MSNWSAVTPTRSPTRSPCNARWNPAPSGPALLLVSAAESAPALSAADCCRRSVADERAVRAQHDKGERLRLGDGADRVVRPEGHTRDRDRVRATPLGDGLAV